MAMQSSECSRCGNNFVENAVTSNGWIVFIILLIVFWPLCFIPLISMKKPRCTVCKNWR